MTDKHLIHESFHPEISDVIQELIHRKIKGFDAQTMQELINSIKTLQDKCYELLLPLKFEVVGVQEQEK